MTKNEKEMYAAMDAAAAAFWAYPCQQWQEDFVADWNNSGVDARDDDDEAAYTAATDAAVAAFWNALWP